jgi:GDPmannose 4,6-dehydratase
MQQKSALIIGMTGQDGSLLARFLLRKGYLVWGTSRNTRKKNLLSNLTRLGIEGKVKLYNLDPKEYFEVLNILATYKPGEVYFLGGQSSVGISFEIPTETRESIVLGTINFLEAIKTLGMNTRFFHPSSSECFGNIENLPANESTPFNPVSPYGEAKSAAHQMVIQYRSLHNIFACNGILFNHESPFRQENFVSYKLVKAAEGIAEGRLKDIELGRIDIMRDWGWAPDYVKGMWLSLQHQEPGDYLFATGEAHTLEYFAEKIFASYGLKLKHHLKQSTNLNRPLEINCIYGDPSKAINILSWKPKYKMADVAKMLVHSRKRWIRN